MGRIAVTGASGFLGSYLLRDLHRRQSADVVALTRHLPASPPLVASSASTWLHGDLGSVDDCRRLLEHASTVIHLAHASTPITSDRDWPADVQLSLTPTLNLLKAIREIGGRPHIVYASSGGALYRIPRARTPVKESAPCMPLSSYGIVKLAVEQYLRVAARQGWLTATALRIGNPYGVLLPMERIQGFIGVALNRIVHGEPVRVFGSPHNIRDYVHLEDVARMVDLVRQRARGFDIYNVGSGTGHSVQDVLRLLTELTGMQVVSEFVDLPPSAHTPPPWIVLDVEKARKQLGWKPSIEFRRGLQALCDEALCIRPT